MKSLYIILLPILLSFNCENSSSQSYNGAFYETFYGRNPSARAEALGRSGVALTGDPWSHFANPASLATLYGGFGALASSSDYYANPETEFYFLSAAYSFGKAGTFGLIMESIYPGNIMNTGTSVPSIPELISTQTSYDRIYYARSISESFFWGVGITFFRPGFRLNENSPASVQDDPDDFGAGFDVGLLKSFDFHTQKNYHRLNLGMSWSNIFAFPYESSALPAPIGLPSVIRIGANYNFTKNHDFRLGFTLEYEDNVNSFYYEAIHAGIEMTFYEWLVLRSGYFAQDLRDCEECSTGAGQFTYGLGIKVAKVPLVNYPISADFDATLMEQLPLQKEQVSWNASWTISFNLGIVF